MRHATGTLEDLEKELREGPYTDTKRYWAQDNLAGVFCVWPGCPDHLKLLPASEDHKKVGDR